MGIRFGFFGHICRMISTEHNLFTKAVLLVCLIALAIGLNSCKDKEEDEPDPIEPVVPELTIKTGYFESFNSFNFVNQDTLYVDSLQNNRLFNLNVTESGLPLTETIDIDSLQFSFTLNSYLDNESFNTESNASMYYRSVFEFNNLAEIDADIQIPIKWTSSPTPNNDTLEINPDGDILTIDYDSYHSELKGQEVRTVK